MKEIFEIFYTDVIETNKVMNLTTITDHEEFHVKHIKDSLLALDIIKKEGKELRIADIGTGAGFPGIPLAIEMPENEFMLADSLDKRIRFIHNEVEKLGLNNVSAVHGRAEEMAKAPEYREKYDVVVSRGVANLSTLSEYLLPFVRIGGIAIAYKSENAEEEISEATKAISILGGKIESIEMTAIPETDIIRKMVVIRKIKTTPPKYPRSGDKPRKQPLNEKS